LVGCSGYVWHFGVPPLLYIEKLQHFTMTARDYTVAKGATPMFLPLKTPTWQNPWNRIHAPHG